jgi:hypothetical protein
MPQLRDKQRNNVKAGIFVLFTLILGIVVIAVLTNLWEAITIKTSKYHASFKVLDGVGTLSVGSKVRLGGVSIGSISSVTPQIVNGEPIENIDVYFDINSDILLYNNVSLEVHTGLLGSQAWLSIDDVGEGDLATSESLLVGSSSTMVAQLLGSEADKNIRKTLNALQRISKSLSEDGEALRLLLGKKEADEIAIAITAAKEGLQSIQELGDGLQTVWPTWESSVSHLLTESKDLPEKLKATLMEAQKMVADIRANTLPSVEKSIVSLEATSKSLESITRSLQESSPRWTNKVNSILANVDQITSRAKLAVDDISASPWRLLYRPTDREIAFEQLNDASWQLLTALSELSETAADLRDLVESKDTPIDRAEVSALSKSLIESGSAFESARETILERMHIDFPDRLVP